VEVIGVNSPRNSAARFIRTATKFFGTTTKRDIYIVEAMVIGQSSTKEQVFTYNATL